MKSRILALALSLMTLPAFAAVSATVEAPESAKLGEQVSVSVKTDAKLKCKIEAQDAGVTQLLKLTDQDSGADGKATWTFEIPKDYKADEMPIIVTVVKDKEEQKVTKSIKIAK